MLARQGIEIPREARIIHIHELNLIERSNDFVTLEVRCSKGTYIRNLIDDIGQTLGWCLCLFITTARRRCFS